MTATTASDSESSASAPGTDDGGTDRDVGPPPGDRTRRSNRVGVLCGLVAFAYAVFLAVEVVVAGFDHRLYNRLHEAQGNVFARVALGIVVMSTIYHGLNGLRIVIADLPGVARHDDALRNLVAFATFALGIPAAAVILWPSISELFR